MSYCLAIQVDEGLVFASDSRTNAGVDRISSYRKMFTFEKPGDRALVILTAGNLAITQSVVTRLKEDIERSISDENEDVATLFNVPTMFRAARVVGQAMRAQYEEDKDAFKELGIEFNAALILGGQIKGESPKLFNVYNAGNFIEASSDAPYFQIGEAKYGKPILDRVIQASTSIPAAKKCALISIDSTLRSNISVAPPIDLVTYQTDKLALDPAERYLDDDPYFNRIRRAWGRGLQQLFDRLPDPA